jgi:hypothetical protein
VLATPVSPARAYLKSPSPDDIKAALDYGKARRGQDLVDSTDPHFIRFPGFGFAILVTPWLQVARLARNAATKYQEVAQGEIDDALSTWTGKLEVNAYLIDNHENFWRNSHSVMIQGNTTIQPLKKESSYRGVVSCSSSPCTVGATFFFVFEDGHLDNAQPAELVILIQQGYKELRVKADLAAIR